MHASNSGADGFIILSHTLGGVVYGLAFSRTKSLLLPVMLHFTWNAMQGPLMGINVSGTAQQGFFDTTIAGSSPWYNSAYGMEGGVTGVILRFIVLFLLVVYLRMIGQQEHSSLPLDNP